LKYAIPAALSASGVSPIITIKYNGQDVSLGAGDVEALSEWHIWPRDDEHRISPVKSKGMGAFTGQQPEQDLSTILQGQPSSKFQEVVQEYAKTALRQPDGVWICSD